MNIPFTDQAVIVRVPTKHSELFTKDVSYSPTSIEAGDILVNAGYDAKTRSLEARRMQLQPTQFAASAPQLTPPKTLPEGQDALKLLNDLEKFDDMGVQVDEERLLKYVDDAIHYTYTAPLAAVVNTYTPSVDARIKALLLKMVDNGTASQNNRSKNRQVALDLYSKAVTAKIDAIHKQGLHGLTGSLGAALGSGFIAAGGLTIQGRATTKKTDVVNNKEILNAKRQDLRDEDANRLKLEHELRGNPLEGGNPKIGAYDREKNQVDRDIIDAKQKAKKARNEATALRAENRQLGRELGFGDEGMSSGHRPFNLGHDTSGLSRPFTQPDSLSSHRPSSARSITDPDFFDTKPVQHGPGLRSQPRQGVGINSSQPQSKTIYELPSLDDIDMPPLRPAVLDDRRSIASEFQSNRVQRNYEAVRSGSDGLPKLPGDGKPPVRLDRQPHLDEPPLPLEFRSNKLKMHHADFEQKRARYGSNEQRIRELDREQQVQFNRKLELEDRKPDRLNQIDRDHHEAVKLIGDEKESKEKVRGFQREVDALEIDIERVSIVAEREHTIGWTIVNLQTMSQALQSGLGVEVKNAEGKAVKEDGVLNALQGELQIHEQALSHDENVKDGLKSALAEVGRSHNDTLRGLKSV